MPALPTFRQLNESLIAAAVALVLLMPATAADLPPSPAPETRTSVPASQSPLAAPDATCLEWSDNCRTCQRPAAGGDPACSNTGIACQPKQSQCTRR
jgi:hypothetical protein